MSTWLKLLGGGDLSQQQDRTEARKAPRQKPADDTCVESLAWRVCVRERVCAVRA